MLSKLLYASAIWAVGSSKDAWNKLERVKKDYFKTHFTLHKKTPSALLWLELGIQPVQVEALISAIQFYQQISNMSQQRLPCMALEASKSMQSVWWQAFLKWLKEWDVQPDQVLDMDPLDIRNHAFQKLWKDVNMDRLQKLHILRFGRKNKSVMEKYLSETWSFKMSRAILAFRIQATPWAMTHRFKYEAGELLPPCHLCHTPTNVLDDHLLFQCSQLQTYKEEFPLLHTQYTTLVDILQNLSHSTAVNILRLYYAISRAIPKPGLVNPIVVPEDGMISDSSEDEEESCITRGSDRLYRSHNRAPVPTSTCVLRSQSRKEHQETQNIHGRPM